MNNTEQRDAMKRLRKPIYAKDSDWSSSPLYGEHDLPMATGFNKAVLIRFKAPMLADVSATMYGAQDYQIGDYTWDSDPEHVDVVVTWYEELENGSIVAVKREEQFNNLPALWDALR